MLTVPVPLTLYEIKPECVYIKYILKEEQTAPVWGP